MSANTLSPAEGLLLRAAMYELLAVGYAYPDAGWRQRLLDLAAELAPWVGLLDPQWPGRLAALQAAASATDPAAAEADFNRLFSGGMDAAPLETAYEPDIFRKQHALADMAGFYRAFGFQLPAATRWQPDHLGVQMEFCAILLQRTALALEQDWGEQVEICVDALRKFLGDHPGRWATAFAADLSRAAREPFYQHLAAVTSSWVELELRILDLAPDRLRARKIDPGDLELPTCGGCSGCGPQGPVPGAPCPLPGEGGAQP